MFGLASNQIVNTTLHSLMPLVMFSECSLVEYVTLCVLKSSNGMIPILVNCDFSRRSWIKLL